MVQNKKGKRKEKPTVDNTQEDVDRELQDDEIKRIPVHNRLARLGWNKGGKGRADSDEGTGSELSVYQPIYAENPLSEERQLLQESSASSAAHLPPPNGSRGVPSSGFFDGSSGIAIKGGNFNQTYGHHTNVTVHNVHFNHLPSMSPCGAEHDTNYNTTPPSTQDIHSEQLSPIHMYEQGPSMSRTIYSPDNSNKIYERHLGPKKRGFPLWIPEPNRTLPMSYRHKGINIGDVGTITPSGGFSFLFNICSPHDDPINPAALPEGFAPIYPPVVPTDIREYSEFKPESYLASTSIEKTHNDPPFLGLSFVTSSEEGALLTFPDGAIARDLDNVRRFREYAEANIESWYRYVNGPRGREAKNGDVRLVIGCDKATSWGMAAVGNMNPHKVHYLKYRSVGDAGTTPAPAIPLYKWEYTGLAEARVGPDLQEIEDLKRDDDSGVAVGGKYWNQCLFMRTLNIALSDAIFAKINRELDSASQKLYNREDSGSSATNPPKIGAQTRGTDQQLGTNSAAETGPTSELLGLATEQMTVREGVTISRTPSAPILHPADFLNRLLLQKIPNGRVVITQDEDWCSIIKEDDTIIPSPSEIAERVLATHHIKEEDGVVFLEPKIRTSAFRHRQTASSYSTEDHPDSRSHIHEDADGTVTAIRHSIRHHQRTLKPSEYNPMTPISQKNSPSSRNSLSIVSKGITIQTIVPGDSTTFPKKGDKVTVHYVGMLMDDKKFDSSRERGSPFQFEIGSGKVIKGWDEGLLQLSLGQKALLTVMPNFAYGSRGFPPTVPPNSTLKFEIELLKIDSNPASG